MEQDLTSFFSQYDQSYIDSFLNNLKNKELSKSPTATANDFLVSFSYSFPISLLQDYHKWLTSHYILTPKDEI